MLMIPRPVQQPRQPYSNAGYMPNGASAPGATPLLPNQGRVIQQGPFRVLCIADVRGGFLEHDLSITWKRADKVATWQDTFSP